MSEPIEAQIKEFWEWCGFHRREQNISVDWWTPDGGHWGSNLPDIDLNNLFEFAVPKVKAMGLSVEINSPYNSSSWWAHIIKSESWSWGEKYTDSEDAVDEDPALALFWCIFSILDKDTP